MRIAIIGAGISGLVSAYLLKDDHDIIVFEANDYIGGHTHTIDVNQNGTTHAVDTGFIVFNEVTYPNFCKLLKKLGVASQPTVMTFSIKCEKTGLEYNVKNLNTLFAQRKNLLSPSFYRLLWEIFRFRRAFSTILQKTDQEMGIRPYLRSHGYSDRFIDQFVVPIGSSLWSADPDAFGDFPLGTFVQFFQNHGFINLKNPLQWRVITGGSERYVDKLAASFKERVRTQCPVREIRRLPDHVAVISGNGETETYDQVILAVHSDQALAMLSDASPTEKEILSAIPYQENLVQLHTETAIMPERRFIWASWNYLIPSKGSGRAAVTYDMNILQGLEAKEEFLVTLNCASTIAQKKEIGRYIYHHPIYSTQAPVAQARHHEISGVNRTHYCGAYWGFGFHEDGVKSALQVCRSFGKGL
ncbi:MAG: FAD-dependent oxidoreductase [Desulfobacterales bacterium]|jgi:predicted NAD/FAD-binding protein|nr:FAD-dependent oxidoreductase [Desulfobacterales bacterium]